MKIQRQLGNGMWDDIEPEFIDQYINKVLLREPWYAPRVNRTPMSTQQEVLDFLATGKPISHGDDWYSSIRDADAIKRPVERRVDFPDGRKLSCGHTVYSRSEIMSASLGSSCQDCYDRMSG